MVKMHARRRNKPVGLGAPTALGDAVAADHRVSNSPQSEALCGSRYEVVVLDVGTRWREVCPSAENDGAETRPSASVKSLQRDGAREPTMVAIDRGMCPST